MVEWGETSAGDSVLECVIYNTTTGNHLHVCILLIVLNAFDVKCKLARTCMILKDMVTYKIHVNCQSTVLQHSCSLL